ncbi:MAG: biotin--[acetyl-CoA-carboxylase] ligase [Actinomycetota bacterium]|nr:biotin--[acetyl-CoA-carboxylase] ligase [Actinomycetota bacterium]
MDDNAPATRLTRLVADSARWREIEHLEVADSTNAVVADHQTAGRGRFGRRWEDRPGGSLLVSCLVDTPARPTLVPLAAGLAVADSVGSAGAEPELKWPNDVLVAGRKCAGVLVEACTHQLVIGIGVNVDWRGAVSPGSWTSLAEELGHQVDRWDVLVDLLRALDRRLAQGPDDVLADYREVCSTLGRNVVVEGPARTIVGLALDVDERGALAVRTDDRVLSLDSGDVAHLRPTASGS